MQNMNEAGQREVCVAAALVLPEQGIFLAGLCHLCLSLPPEPVWLPSSAVAVQCCCPHRLVTGALLSLGHGVGRWLGCLALGGVC